MTKSLWITVLTLLAAIPAAAQTSGYRFDNFDTRNGVRIQMSPGAVPPRSNKGRSQPRKAAIQNDNLVRLNSMAYSSPKVSTANTSNSLDGFTTGDSTVDGFIVDSGTRNGVDPVLLYAIMHQESTFKKRALSPKGASGLMQLMPPTARRFGVTKIWDPRQNIEGGARYMRFLLNYFGDVRLALAGYNAGEGAVEKYGRRIPPYQETQEYVRRIYRRYSLMRDPKTMQDARTVTPTQMASVKSQAPVALNVYERSVFAVKMPDGRLQLVSQ